jgi:hypothetical protein
MMFTPTADRRRPRAPLASLDANGGGGNAALSAFPHLPGSPAAGETGDSGGATLKKVSGVKHGRRERGAERALERACGLPGHATV